MKARHSRNILLLVSVILFTAACGGGGGGDPEPGDPSGKSQIFISGTAAAGSPIVGIVNVKGANGKTASSPIELDGSYSINVTALTEPYILYAEGTVNGKTVKYYSSGVTGTINISHLTDYILRNATQDPPGTVYGNWINSQVSAAALSTAGSEAIQQLQALIVAVPSLDSSTLDLITTAFKADHTDLDFVLDVIDITIDGNTVTVTNNLTGSQFTNDLTTPNDNGNALPPGDTAATVTALSHLDSINQMFDQLETLYATQAPSDTDINSFFNQSVADGYLENGVTKTEELNRYLAGEGLGIGVKIYAAIEGVMDVGTAYQNAYWIQLYFDHPDFSGVFRSAVVFDGSNWLWYGNQQWLYSNIHVWAQMNNAADGSVSFQTGFDIGGDGLRDETNYAYDQGVRSGIITGPGLPAAGLVIQHQYPEPNFGFLNGDPDDPSKYWLTDDSVILSIEDNATYTIRFYAQAADVVTLNDTPLQATSTTTMKRPYTSTELSAVDFPVLISPNAHNLADTNIPGDSSFTWQNAASSDVVYAVLGWWDGAAWNQLESFVEPEMTSHTFDTNGYPSPVALGLVGLIRQDQYQRLLAYMWKFN